MNEQISDVDSIAINTETNPWNVDVDIRGNALYTITDSADENGRDIA